MAEYKLFPTKIVTPEGVLFEGDVQELEVSSVNGGLGILARRSPVVADLKVGRIRIKLQDGSFVTWATDQGFAQASDSTATVVVEDAVPVDEIDDAEAQTLIAVGAERLAACEQTDPNGHEATAARRQIAWGEHLATFRAKNPA
ncbi:MAG: synthase epsilon subunit [Thermoleophilia bacterium]|jgi:F-type H+-transporting ATPase subunit epsilon|nr:synthase epsilon subunit [Thermoleophilia bacterium]